MEEPASNTTTGRDCSNRPSESGRLPFHTFRELLIRRYGEPLYRVALDLGLSCPHRRPDGSGGCTFCAADGSRARYLGNAVAIADQVLRGVEFARRRYGANRFMAYVQAFTGTFASVDEQRRLYETVLGNYTFDALSIATRPDCLPPATIALLAALKQRVDVWVEVGVQTVHDRTLERINRGHDWETSRRAILSLAQAGLHVLVHVIIGLPGESSDDFRVTAKTIGGLPVEAIKIHNLHVVRGTILAEEYAACPFPVYDEYQYAELLIDFLRHLPDRMAIARINTDTPAADLIAPRWKMDKARFRHYVATEMIRRGIRQGDLAVDPAYS
ncbi:MAG: TIGR01212 family radical SAM protein [Kiritimatiellia bacterium]